LAFVKRLSSLPEHKKDNDWRNPSIEGAKGFYMPCIKYTTNIRLDRSCEGRDVRRSSLEFTFYNASTHIDRLNEAIETADSLDEEDEEA